MSTAVPLQHDVAVVAQTGAQKVVFIEAKVAVGTQQNIPTGDEL
jgi:hypothetical protein